MKRTTLILTLAAAMILSLGCVAHTGRKQAVAAHPAAVIYYGDTPVSLTAESFRSSLDLSVLAR
jgi:hypothetical protein